MSDQAPEEVITEQRNPRSAELDRMPVADVLALLNEEDATVAKSVRAALPQIVAATELMINRIAAGGRARYVGAGTSGRIALLDALEWPPPFGTGPDLVQAIVAGGAGAMVESAAAAEDDPARGEADLLAAGVTARDLVVGLSASGRTPYVIGALQAARRAGAATVGIACNPRSPLASLADVCIEVIVGPEVLTGSTRLKAGTAQKMVLNMMSTAAMAALGKVYSNLMVDVRPLNAKLLDRARRIVAAAAGISVAEASAILAAAGNQVKPAIVMAVAGCDLATAQQRLARASGFVRAAIEER